jgi:hypothetical protein
MPITQDRFADHATRARYPFRNMALEECAVFEPHEDWRRIARAAYMTAARHGMKFTVRRCNDERIRVWRIA